MTGDCLKVFADHKRPVYALSMSPKGDMFATGGGDGWLYVYDVAVSFLSHVPNSRLSTFSVSRETLVMVRKQ